MKQITQLGKYLFLLSILLLGTDVIAQSQFNSVITGGSTSQNGRAPQGLRAITRTVFIVTDAEMTAGGFVSGDQISGLGFSYETGQDITTTGNIKIYLQNTTATTNNKGTNWATIITGMTLASDATTTIPAAVGDYNIEFSNGNTFNYTGGNLFVAFDYQNLSNPVAGTPNVSYCNNSPVGGAQGVFSALSASGSTAPPTTLSGSNFRPQVRLGLPVACARPTNLGFTNPTANTADLTWTPNGGTGIELEYGPQGFDQATAGTLLTGPTVSSPYTLTGLTPNSVYDYYVRTVCAGNVSNWNGPFTFTSLFEPSNLPYNTSFENDEFSYYGWRFERDPSGTVGNFWQSVNFGAGDPSVQDGAYSARVGAGVTTAQANDWIISSGVNLAANQTVNISFYTGAIQTGSTTDAAYNLTVGTAQNSAAQTTSIASGVSFNNTAFQINNHSYTAPSAGVYYFGVQNAIAANPAGSVFWALDNFTIDTTATVDDIAANTFRIYPNPANDIITINSDNHTIKNLSITDMNGREVMNTNVDDKLSTQLDVTNLSSGLYLMSISSDQGNVTKRFVKN
ncbi:MAG: T9SS type A sorting domain-containing protein [Nonlabens sp.]|uniref:T9SS type A sorting domain-containing protein n=1 Tax=Nonlabens sp. TaxID=1888209 RepID=UPI003EF51A13